MAFLWGPCVLCVCGHFSKARDLLILFPLNPYEVNNTPNYRWMRKTEALRCPAVSGGDRLEPRSEDLVSVQPLSPFPDACVDLVPLSWGIRTISYWSSWSKRCCLDHF